MVFKVKNSNKIVPSAEAEITNQVSPLEHNTGSNDIPPAVLEVPMVLGKAMIDSEKTAERCQEIQDELVKVANESMPDNKEVEETDKIAAGKTRTHDYTHPVVDNIYTGKFILDEGVSTRAQRIREARGFDRADVGENGLIHARVSFPGSEALQNLVMNYLLVAPGYSFGSVVGGIYPDDSAGVSGNNEAEALFQDYLKSDKFDDDVNKEIKVIIKTIKKSNAETTNETKINMMDIIDDAERLVKERKKKEFREKSTKGVTANSLTDGPAVRVTNSRCEWTSQHLNGNIVSPNTIKIAGSKGHDPLKRNFWMSDYYETGDILCTEGEPVGISFASNFLESINFRLLGEKPYGDRGLKYYASNPYVFVESGNTIDIFYATEPCEIDVTPEEFASIKRNFTDMEEEVRKATAEYREGVIPVGKIEVIK